MVAATHPQVQQLAARRANPRLLPIVATVVSVSLVASYVSNQLSYERRVMDSRFAQYNNTRSEDQRRKTFEGTNGDPRTSLFNILGH